MQRNLIVTTLVALLMAGFVLAYTALRPADAQVGMGGGETMDEDMVVEGPVVPPVVGLAEGEEILFLHTEASAPEVAEMLTAMMGSPVLVVPELADVPEEALANVYVFTNGIEGMGPLGFQPDVFDNLPGGEGYTPLRAINQVTWVNPEEARLLTSVEEVEAAWNAGEITIERPGAVVNMPIIKWPGGER
ncbi:MAG: hypothetical protein M3220_17280 [Chloroflexota bacterium]|nr:hypothetical protein [Chloroflexota bacterium]